MTENSPQHSSSSTPPCPPSEKEAKFYYIGLPSRPVLVARTGTTPWKEPTWEDPNEKELRPVGNHALKEVWEDILAPKIFALLDLMKVKWTSIDVVRIREARYPSESGSVILWIGVLPASLSGNDGVVVASKCQEILIEHNVTDVDVEIRESVVTRSAGPKLHTSEGNFTDPTTEVREPLTPTLGLPICAESMPWVEGTSGFFITEDGDTKRLLLVTARHVVFTPDKNENKHFVYVNDSHHHYNVRLFSDATFNKYLKSIMDGIRGNAINFEYRERCIKAVERKGNPTTNKERQYAQDKLDELAEAIEKLNILYQDVSTHWATPESRVLGHVILSPPISIDSNSGGYTEDWAVIEIDPSKVDASNFRYNAINLGARIPIGEFTGMMCPNFPEEPYSFKYPFDRLLRLEGTIPDDEMRHPTALDWDNQPYLMVIKRGNGSGLTVGHANDIFSYARNYYDDDKPKISKEWPVLSLDHKSTFSEKGDSGSVIVDGQGRIGGLLTSGAGTTESLDITYATPISFLLKCMQDHGLHNPNINPTLTTQMHSPD